MAKYVSGRQQNLKIGITSYSENLTSLEVIGNVGIATTNATSKLYVVGDGYFTGILTANRIVSTEYGEFTGGSISGSNIVGTSLSISGISTLGITSTTDLIAQQLNVAGVTTLGIVTADNIFSTGIITATSFRPSSGYIQSPNGTNSFYIYDGTGNVAFQGTIGASQINNASEYKVIGFAGTNVTFENNALIAGVTTSTGGFVGNLTGIATTALNLSHAANITTGTINSARLSGTYNIDINGNAATATYATTSGIATYATSAGIATYATNAGVTTALQYSRDFSITGDIVASPISFDGTGNVSLAATIQPNSVALGNDTTGDYVQTVSGTVGQINVTGGTGESSTPVIAIANNPTIPGNVTIGTDLQVNNNLNVTGNITVGGTAAYIIVQDFRVTDADITLGFTTDAYGNDNSTDTTANHGGIAVASTEGNPLVQLVNVAIGESLPATYKKFMWFKAGAFTGLNTDAWLSNYAIGIGSTQFPSGTRLAAGSVQFTENDLAVVRNINATGITTVGLITANNLYVSGVGTFLSSGLVIRNPANTFGYTIAGGAIANNYTLTLPVVTSNTGIAVTGLAQTFTAAQTFNSTLTAVSTLVLSSSTTSNNTIATNSTTGTLTVGGPSQTGTITLGQATTSQITNIQAGASGVGTTKTINFGTGGLSGSFTQINIGPGPSAGVGTVTINAGTNLLVGTTTSTGTASQPLQVTGGAYVSSNTGIGTTNPVATLQVKDALAFETTNTTTTSTTQVAVDTFATATFRSAKYQVQVTCPGQISTLGGITTGGRGYTAGTYNVTFTTSSGNGSAAQGTLTISNGTVGQIGLGTTGGSGYTAGDVLTASGGSGLQVSVGTTDANGSILTLGSITSAGIGYTAGVGVGTTTLSFLGGTGTGAVGLATIFDGVITSSTLLQQPTTGTGGTVYYSGSNYTTSSVLTINRTDVTNTITTITGSVGVSTFTSLTSHGLFVNDIIRTSSTSNGLTAGSDYYVVTTPDTTSFTLGASVGIGTTFTAGTSLSIGFYRQSANAGGFVTFTNAITGISTNYQVSDILVLQNGSTADFVEYAGIANNDILGTFAADISGANARLLITPTYPNNTVRVARQVMLV